MMKINKKQIDNLIKELSNLQEKNLIKKEQISAIEAYYQEILDNQPSSNLFFTLFAGFGALLIGIGIISLISFNWAFFDKTIKTIIAFLPTILGQIIFAYTLLKKQESAAWREGASIFLTLAISASIAIISQIYQLSGDNSSFFFISMFLSLPIIYLARSTGASVIYLIASVFTWGNIYYTWTLSTLILPFIYLCTKENKYSMFATIQSILFSILIGLAILYGTHVFYDYSFQINRIIFGIYALALFCIGTFYFQQDLHLIRLSGILQLCFMAYLSVFKTKMSNDNYFNKQILLNELKINDYNDFIFTIIMVAIIALILAFYIFKFYEKYNFHISEWVLISFPIISLFSFVAETSLIFNIYFIILSLALIYHGVKQNILRTASFGSFLLGLYILTKFLCIDTDLIIKGIGSIFIGIIFLIINYILKKSMKANKKELR